MIKTIKDLITQYKLNLKLPDYVLNYEFPESVESYGEHHTETIDEKTIHIFTTTHENTKIENILDPNEPVTWTELIYKDGNRPSYKQTIIKEDTIIEG